MKAPIIPLTAMLWTGGALMGPGSASAQVQPGKYDIWTFGQGSFLPIGAISGVSIAFNYGVKPAGGGSPAMQTFTGAVSRPFSTGVFYLSNFSNLEIVRKQHSFNWGLGLFAEHGVIGFSWVEGYSRLVPIGKFLLKPGLDLHLIASGKKPIGNIDNRGVEIDLFGTKAFPQFQSDNGADDDSQSVTYDAARLKVEYEFTVVFFEPKLVLATPPWRKWVFSLESGYMLPTGPDASLAFVQVDSGGNNRHEVGEHPIDRFGFSTGLHFAFNAGIAW